MKDHEEKAAFMVTDIGTDDVVIGIDWLRYHNPEIDWNAGKVQLTRCPVVCEEKTKRKKKRLAKDGETRIIDACEVKEPTSIRKASVEEVDDEYDELFIKAKASVATELAVQELEKQKKKSFKELVPEWIHDFEHVFSEEESKRFPERKKWDHGIDLKDENSHDVEKIEDTYQKIEALFHDDSQNIR